MQKQNQTRSQVLVLKCVGVAVVVLVAFFMWFGSYVHRYVRTEPFRISISQKTSNLFSAEGAFLPLTWNDSAVSCDEFYCKGKPNVPLRQIRARNLKCVVSFASLWRRRIEIDELKIKRVEVALGKRQVLSESAEVAAKLALQENSRTLLRPIKVDVRRISVAQSELTWNAGELSAGGIHEFELVLDRAGKKWNGIGSGGQLQQKDWPALNIGKVVFSYLEKQLDIDSAQFTLAEGGTLQASGTLDFTSEAAADLKVLLNKIPIALFISQDWQTKLNGTLEGEVRVIGPLGTRELIQTSGPIRLTGGFLKDLPVLNKIAAFTHAEAFRKLPIDLASADFTLKNGNWVLKNATIESRALIKIQSEGEITIKEGMIDGMFQVGMAESSLHWLPGARKRVFTAEKNGYVWTVQPMHLTGPLNHPVEDLSHRLVAAAQTEIVEGVKGIPKGALDLIKSIFK